MDLRLYDTLTREKRSFVPLNPDNVRMYVCGPTVYDFAHIGNARPVIVFDVLFRLLRHLYGADHVTYVRNITDVDDKINDRAMERGISIRALTEETYRTFKEDLRALDCLEPTVEPRATEHIMEMQQIIEELISNGSAYVAHNHVLFAVTKMPTYGQLARQSVDEMLIGARIDPAPYKRDPLDFTLWKPSRPGEPAWPSPAGIPIPGRPGWHIECSAMAWKHLGKEFDIHGGGIDLVFPHHENERAQSCCAFHTERMANIWMHNGFLQVEGQKMSKSLGNFLRIVDARRDWHGRAWSGGVLKLAMLFTHYRQPINWSLERLVAAEKELFSVADEFSSLLANEFKDEFGPFAEWIAHTSEDVDEGFLQSIMDDLNTPEALAALRSKYGSIGKDKRIAGSVLSSFELLGILDRKTLFLNSSPILRGFFDPEAIHGGFLVGRKLQIGLLNKDPILIQETQSLIDDLGVEVRYGPAGMMILVRDSAKVRADRDRITQLVEQRAAARARKDFKESDRIRDELAAMGVTLRDFKDPVTGEMKTEIAR